MTWRLDPALYEAVRAAAHAAGLSVQAFASQASRAAVEPSPEDRAWLEADCGGALPPYDWGPAGPPQGRPVWWVPGQGLVVEGGRDAR